MSISSVTYFAYETRTGDSFPRYKPFFFIQLQHDLIGEEESVHFNLDVSKNSGECKGRSFFSLKFRESIVKEDNNQTL